LFVGGMGRINCSALHARCCDRCCSDGVVCEPMAAGAAMRPI